jgi:HPt (histidine-containing phosphotransfer) domain-containing protein
MIIDFGFGLSQLSGSEDLLITLLGKLKKEYNECDQTLEILFEHSDWEAARMLVHTLKGVSGNLGCVALHNASKSLDDSLKHENKKPDEFDVFCDALHATIKQITLVEQAGTIVDIAKNNASSDSHHNAPDAKQSLIDLLNENAFISPEGLDEYMQKIELPKEEKAQIEQSINLLNYRQAIQLLTR